MTKYPESGEAYKSARHARGITQEALSVISGVSRREVIRIERGEHRPFPRTRDLIANALGADPASLPAVGEAPFQRDR